MPRESLSDNPQGPLAAKPPNFLTTHWSRIQWGFIGLILSGLSYTVVGVYDLKNNVERMPGDLKNSIDREAEKVSASMKRVEETLSIKLDNKSKQLEKSEKDIEKIRQTLLTLVFSSGARQEDKERMIRQLGTVLDPQVTTAATEFTRGQYSSAYSKWFALSGQGNADARLAIMSASDVIYNRIQTNQATPKEREAFSVAIQRAKQLGITDLIGRYKGIDPVRAPYRPQKGVAPEIKETTPEPGESANDSVTPLMEDARKAKETVTPKDLIPR